MAAGTSASGARIATPLPGDARDPRTRAGEQDEHRRDGGQHEAQVGDVVVRKVGQVQRVVHDHERTERTRNARRLAAQSPHGQEGHGPDQSGKHDGRVHRHQILRVGFQIERDVFSAEEHFRARIAGCEKSSVELTLRPAHDDRPERGAGARQQRTLPIPLVPPTQTRRAGRGGEHERNGRKRRQNRAHHDGRSDRASRGRCAHPRSPQAHLHRQQNQRRRWHVAHRRNGIVERYRRRRDQARGEDARPRSCQAPAEEKGAPHEQAGEERRNDVHAELAIEQVGDGEKYGKAQRILADVGAALRSQRVGERSGHRERADERPWRPELQRRRTEDATVRPAAGGAHVPGRIRSPGNECRVADGDGCREAGEKERCVERKPASFDSHRSQLCNMQSR